VSLSDFLKSDRTNWPPFLQECELNLTWTNVTLSIVVPTYNAANFISETLNRIRDIPEAEIFILDDGSTDATIRVAQDLLRNHPNFAIFKLSRKGAPGQARNFGASIARGKWIWFLDCDDLPMKSNLKELFEVGTELSCDLMILRYLVRYDHSKTWTHGFDHQLFSRLSQSNYKLFRNWFQEPKLIRLSPHPSRMIYSKVFIMKHNLEFDTDETFEDGSFWPRALKEAQNILTWNWPELVYRVREDSITHSQDLDRKLFLLSQFKSIFHNKKLSSLENRELWGHSYMYGLEMIIWPLNSLIAPLRLEYKNQAQKMLNDLGAKWFARSTGITFQERFLIAKSLLKFGCMRLSFICILGAVK
jgi:glycosyltransferase involved in cell wall biosynthesis